MRTPSIQHARNYEAPADVERASMLHLAIFLIGSTAADVCVDFSERSGLRLDDDSERFVHSGWKDWRKAQRYYANGSVAVVPVGENEFKVLDPFGAIRAQGALNAHGRPTGNWSYFSATGRTAWEVTFGENRAVDVIASMYCEHAVARIGGFYIELSCTDANGVRDGRYETVDIAARTLIVGQFDAGKKSGAWQYYSLGGCRLKQESYYEGKLHGPYIKWSDGGSSVSDVGTFSNGYPIGIFSFTCGCVINKVKYKQRTEVKEVTYFDHCGPTFIPISPRQEIPKVVELGKVPNCIDE